MNKPIYIGNPEDGIATYDVIEIFRSADAYAAVYATPDIDLTTRSQYGPGFTLYVDLNGNNYSYKVRFKDSVSGAVTGFSPVLDDSSSYAAEQTRKVLKDTDTAEIFTDLELKDIEQRAVGKLFPRLMVSATDASKTLATTQIDYDLPVGAFRVTQVFKGAIANNTWAEIETFETVNGNTLRLSENDISDALLLTIYYKRPFRNSGEVPFKLQPIVIYEMLAECYEVLANDRGVKFKAFQAIQRDSDIRPETLKQMASDSRNTAEKIRSEIERG